MMETVNASRAGNQPFAVIDGGLSSKNGTPTPPTVPKAQAARPSPRSDPHAALQR